MVFDLWLTSAALYRRVVEMLAGQDGLVLHRVEGLDQLPPAATVQGGAVFLDDSYEAVQAAAGLSWRTVWFNPHGRIAPAADPVQDVDLVDMARLPEIRPVLNCKPSLAQCLARWKDWAVPENIRAHARTVSRSAYHLAVLLRNQGVQVDPILTQRGGLLHDIDKIDTLHQEGAHGREGAEFLKVKGYPLLAEIVREHIMSTILHPHADDRPWEVKLVYFTDKLVEGEQLVPFDQRLEALFERYPSYRETMGRAAGAVRRLSDQICSILSIPGHEKLISILIELQNN
jgi:putative nucleotidyltransferase with HDIG domain